MKIESRNRFLALDGLRGVAALMVVLLHSHAEWTNHLTGNNFIQQSYLAVDLFFILSGLVISASYSHSITNLREARNFIGLRFFRLYPLHIAMLGAWVCLECTKLVAQHALAMMPGPQAPFTGDNSPGMLMASVFVVNGLHVVDRLGWNGASWSISCEFAAYLLFSITVLSGLLKSRLFFIAGSLLGGFGYIVLAFTRGSLDVTVDWGIIRCLAGFFFGMLIYRLKHRLDCFLSPLLISILQVSLIITTTLVMSLMSGIANALVIPLLIFTIALLSSDKGLVARLLISAPAQFLGRISYSIYMVHSFFVVCLLIMLKRILSLPAVLNPLRDKPILLIDPWIGDLLVFGLVVAVIATAYVTHRFIEEPGRLWGRRNFAPAGKEMPRYTPARHQGRHELSGAMK